MAQNPDHAVLVSAVGNVVELINSSETKLGDVADVVTGIYTGDDKRHLRMTLRNDGRRKGYAFAGDEVIAGHLELGQEADVLSGLVGPRHFVPIVKGGGVQYWKPIGWVVDWSRLAVTSYKEERKARFQNSKYYFMRGIAVPMVTSTRVSATIMDGSVFDQSIVGVFPHDRSVFHYLLAFFNSPTCTILLRTLNPSANNSSNYMKKLPILFPRHESLAKIGTLVEQAIAKRREGFPERVTEQEIEDAIREVNGF